MNKGLKKDYYVKEKLVITTNIKSRLKDTRGIDYYVYDLFGADNVCVALNRYVLVDNVIEQPFEKLTEEEELILNPIIKELEDVDLKVI